MNAEETYRVHLFSELGPAFGNLAAARERDNATRASDRTLFLVILVAILVTGGLVIYRLWLHTLVRKRSLQALLAHHER
uniref:Wsv293a-like protein n=1 Tax=Sicyonia whispovirus TaxID=2984283 RepID=A0A9C7BN56_9VIRU|nr:MAG: wsv293a-like protein [Sicyonia whispovirus]